MLQNNIQRPFSIVKKNAPSENSLRIIAIKRDNYTPINLSLLYVVPSCAVTVYDSVRQKTITLPASSAANNCTTRPEFSMGTITFFVVASYDRITIMTTPTITAAAAATLAKQIDDEWTGLFVVSFAMHTWHFVYVTVISNNKVKCNGIGCVGVMRAGHPPFVVTLMVSHELQP